ncbi:MAG: sugar phosphate isomerase/epimerase family protein [Planctomycetota bacterium]
MADLPLQEALTIISDAGYEAVELDWNQIEDDLRDILTANKLVVSGINLDDLEPDSIRRQMELARQLGLSGINIQGRNRKSQSLETLVDELKAVIPTAEEFDLSINLDNCYGCRIEQLEDLRYIFWKLNHPQLRIVNDTGQFHRASVNPRDVMREFGDRTTAMRISDMIGDQPVPLGQGEINLPAIIELAKRMNFKGWLVVDVEAANLQGALGYLHKLL